MLFLILCDQSVVTGYSRYGLLALNLSNLFPLPRVTIAFKVRFTSLKVQNVHRNVIFVLVHLHFPTSPLNLNPQRISPHPNPIIDVWIEIARTPRGYQYNEVSQAFKKKTLMNIKFTLKAKFRYNRIFRRHFEPLFKTGATALFECDLLSFRDNASSIPLERVSD